MERPFSPLIPEEAQLQEAAAGGGGGIIGN